MSCAELLVEPPLYLPPLDRRVVYALFFFTGVRYGELAGLRWGRWQRDARPLERLLIAEAWNTKLKRFTETKTNVQREVPVHPVLVPILERWQSHWTKSFGSPPEPHELMCPAERGGPRSEEVLIEQFHRDLARLGRPKRDLRAWRRSFKSLAEADGVSHEVTERICRARPTDVAGRYREVFWQEACREIVKFRPPIDLSRWTDDTQDSR